MYILQIKLSIIQKLWIKMYKKGDASKAAKELTSTKFDTSETYYFIYGQWLSDLMPSQGTPQLTPVRDQEFKQTFTAP